MAAGLFGLGAGSPSRFPYEDRPQPSPGLGPGQSNVVRAILVIITGVPGKFSGLFVYSSNPALGNLQDSVTATSGTDPEGNAYLADITSYGLGTVAVQLAAGSVNYYTAPGPGGPWTLKVTTALGTGTGDLITTILTPAATYRVIAAGLSIEGNAPSPGMLILTPSGDSTGATDLAAINAALAAGQEVHLTPGTFFVNGIIEYPPYAVLRGAGRGVIDALKQTVISAVAAADAVIAPSGWEAGTNTVTPGGPRMSGFIVNGASLATHGIVCQGEDAEFDDIGVTSCTDMAIRLDSFNAGGSGPLSGSPVNGRITRCSLENCGRGIGTNQTSAKFTDWFIVDNIVADMSGLASIYTTRAAGWLISGNHIYGIQQNGIYFAQDFNTLVTGNYIESWGQSATLGTYAAITTSTGGTDGSSNGNKGSVVTGNRIALTANPGNAGSTIYGIRMRCLANNSTAFTVVGNSLECQPAAAAFAAADAIEFRNNAASSVFTAVSTGNNALGNWTVAVNQVPNGGTMTVTAGV